MANGKLVPVIIALAAGAGIGYFATQRYACPSMTQPQGEYALQLALNRLWTDHVVWTRQYIVSALADLPDAQADVNRLMKNQEELGGAIAPYYGAEAGNKLTELLKAHIVIAADVVKAAKNNASADVKTAEEKWHQNADEIAAFLSSANPNWTKQALTDMLYNHLDLTTKEATLRLGQEWDADIANFDKILTQALMMAHTFADGIVKQFPDKF